MEHTQRQIEYYFLSGNKPLQARNLADWMLANGMVAATTHDVSELLGIPENQVRQRMATLRKHGEIVSPARGLWVPIPPEYRSFGAPEPLYYIDALMEHYCVDYCIGWLSAAEIYGVGHQAPQVFQTATARTIRDKKIGQSRLQFRSRDYTSLAARQKITRSAGRAWVSSPETTILMLAEDYDMGGGIDNVATVVVELAEEAESFSEERLIEQAPLFSHAASRRAGWFLETFSSCDPLDALASYCNQSSPSFTDLYPWTNREGVRDERWKLVINREVEPDL
ncbi:MAG: hypothetical protein IJ131_01250 [Eggerthellaceae bacterium]|nr:hypothetical protein [Eggerthellaceae bacterium]